MRAALYLAVFVATVAFRYMLLGDGFPNDHYVYITGGWQMLFGEWPTRDWVDPGLPLMFLASAGSQALLGQTLFAEAVLVSVAFGLGAVLTVAAVTELTGSVGLAVLASVLEVAIVPRTYGYPKILVYAAAFLTFVRYIRQPDTRRLAWMVVVVAIAFLFRHDHGLFLGVGAALTVMLTPDGTTTTAKLRRVVLLALGAGVLVAPYLAYVQLDGGLWTYLQTGIEFSRREAARQWHVWPRVFGDPRPLRSALVYELHTLPVLAVCVLALRRGHRDWSRWVAAIVPMALVAVVINVNFIRDPLETRLPDAIVPGVVLGAWLCARAADARRRGPVLAVCAAGLVLFTWSVAQAGNTLDAVCRLDLVANWNHVPTLLRLRTDTLLAPRAERQLPARTTQALVPFLEYLDRCTTSEHRLLIGGYMVDVPFFARRRFAGGQQYFGGSFAGSPDSERRVLFRLRSQVVPFALLPSDYDTAFERDWPVVSGYLASRYRLLTRVEVTDETTVRVLLDSAVTATGTDTQTGWPCFLPSAGPDSPVNRAR